MNENIVKKITRKARVFIFAKKIKKNNNLGKGILFHGVENMFVGHSNSIGRFSWLASVPLTNEPICELKIGNGCYIGNFSHIYATKSILIEDDVLIADKVYIADNAHGYENMEIPIVQQPIVQKNTVRIGEGSWIGENVCIIASNIGRHSVIGANSVVTKDIPDYCVAVGNPAKIIKKFNPETKCWEKV